MIHHTLVSQVSICRNQFNNLFQEVSQRLPWQGLLRGRKETSLWFRVVIIFFIMALSQIRDLVLMTIIKGNRSILLQSITSLALQNQRHKGEEVCHQTQILQMEVSELRTATLSCKVVWILVNKASPGVATNKLMIQQALLVQLEKISQSIVIASFHLMTQVARVVPLLSVLLATHTHMWKESTSTLSRSTTITSWVANL